MFRTVRTRIARAAAAAAIVGTLLFSALAAPAIDHAYAAAKPDLKITLINAEAPSGNDMHGSIFVENIGNGPANPVALKIKGSRYSNDMKGPQIIDCGVKLLTPLNKGQHTFTTFACEGATAVELTAMTPNDSNPGNNVMDVGNFGI